MSKSNGQILCDKLELHFRKLRLPFTKWVDLNLAQQAAWNEFANEIGVSASAAEFHQLWTLHETFVLDLCSLVELPYEEVNEVGVFNVVKRHVTKSKLLSHFYEQVKKLLGSAKS